MLSLSYQRFDFPFQYPFQIAKGTKTHQPSLEVCLGMGALRGYGEATAISYHDVTVEGMTAVLEQFRGMIERYTLMSPERFWHFLHHLIPQAPFLISALDIAGWDLFGQMRRQPIYQLLGLTWREDLPETDYTIGITKPEEIKERVQAHQHAIYKLKLGSRDDLATLQALRAATEACIRVDANEGWTLEVAQDLLPELEKLNIELIEQPLKKEDLEGQKKLKDISPIKIIADEACQGIKDLPLIADLYDGINVKLSKCSGLTPAVDLIKAARGKGLAIMLGSMSEGVVGASALSHLLPLADYADIDGPLLLNDAHVQGIQYEGSKILKPQGYGIGLRKRS